MASIKKEDFTGNAPEPARDVLLPFSTRFIALADLLGAVGFLEMEEGCEDPISTNGVLGLEEILRSLADELVQISSDLDEGYRNALKENPQERG